MGKLEDLQFMLMENDDGADPIGDLEKFLKERNIDDDTKEALLLLASSYRARNEANRTNMLKIVTAIINDDKTESKETKVEEKPKSKLDGWIKFILIIVGVIIGVLLFLFVMNLISQEHTNSTVKMFCDLVKNISDAFRGQDISAFKN